VLWHQVRNGRFENIDETLIVDRDRRRGGTSGCTERQVIGEPRRAERFEVFHAGHDRAIASAYAEIARMLATDPVEVALVGDAHRESGFIVRGLPAAGAGLVYRVWIRGTSARRSPGILDVTSDGLHVLVTPGDVFAHASSIRVMLERERDAETAPRRLVLEGTVS